MNMPKVGLILLYNTYINWDKLEIPWLSRTFKLYLEVMIFYLKYPREVLRGPIWLSQDS